MCSDNVNFRSTDYVYYIHHCMSSNSAATLHRTMTLVSGLVVLACGALCSEGFVLKQRREAASANQGKFLLEFLLPATLLASYIAIIYKYVACLTPVIESASYSASLLYIAAELVGPCDHDGEVRLVGGRNKFEGIVRVCENGEWTHICIFFPSFDWSITQAQVVCRSLNYSTTGIL